MIPLTSQTKRRFAAILLSIGVLLALYGCAVALHDHTAQHHLVAPGSNETVPSSAKPNEHDVAAYSVAPLLPKYIAVPTLGIEQARIMSLGLVGNHQIAAPGNIYDAGWYKASTQPGQPGAMFVFGHVSSWQHRGIFYNLSKLRPGDQIMITRGDNKTFIYTVVTTRVYSYQNVDMPTVLAPINPHSPGLNLMTCIGQIMPGTNKFSQRLVVFTSLIH